VLKIKRSPDPLAAIWGLLLREEEDREGERRKGMGREEKGRKGEWIEGIGEGGEVEWGGVGTALRVTVYRSIPEDYRVLFLQGGGVGLFSAIPLNFIGRCNQRAADYIIAGSWSNSAAREAEKYANKIHRITPPEGNAHHCMYHCVCSAVLSL